MKRIRVTALNNRGKELFNELVELPRTTRSLNADVARCFFREDNRIGEIHIVNLDNNSDFRFLRSDLPANITPMFIRTAGPVINFFSKMLGLKKSFFAV